MAAPRVTLIAASLSRNMASLSSVDAGGGGACCCRSGGPPLPPPLAAHRTGRLADGRPARAMDTAAGHGYDDVRRAKEAESGAWQACSASSGLTAPSHLLVVSHAVAERPHSERAARRRTGAVRSPFSVLEQWRDPITRLITMRGCNKLSTIGPAGLACVQLALHGRCSATPLCAAASPSGRMHLQRPGG